MDTLTTVMKAFEASFKDGIQLLQPMTISLFNYMLIMDVALSLSRAAWNDTNLWKLAAEKMTRYGIFLFLIKNYDGIFTAVINALISVGLTAGGNLYTRESFADPSWLLLKGVEICAPLKQFFLDTGPTGLSMIGVLLLLVVVYFAVMIAFAIIAIQVFITYLEVYVVGTLAMFFLGCGVNKHFSFLSEKAIGSVFSFGIKLMVLAYIISIAIPQIEKIVAPTDTKDFLSIYLDLLVTVLCIAFLSWQAPGVAAGLMSGAPSLTAGTAAGSAVATGAAAVGSAMLAAGGGKMLSGLMNAAGGNAGGGIADTMKASNAASDIVSNSASGLNNDQGSDSAKGPSLASEMNPGALAASVKDTSQSSGGQASTAASPGGAGQANAATSSTTASPGGAGQANAATSSTAASPGGAGQANAATSSTAASPGGAGQASPPTDSAAASPGGAEQASPPNSDVNNNVHPQSVANEMNPAEIAEKAENQQQQQQQSRLEKLAGKVSLAQQAIASEASPQGGINVPMSGGNDE